MKKTLPLLFLIGLSWILSSIVLWGSLFIPNHLVFEPGDTVLNIWILHYVSENLVQLRDWTQAPMYYPLKGAILFSEHWLLPAPFYRLFYWLTQNRVLAFNFLATTICSLNFLVFYFCVRTWVRPLAAFLGASLFAFGMVRMAQIGHFQLFPQFFLPLSAWALWKYECSEKRRFLIASGLFLAGQFYCSIYLGFVNLLVLVPYLVSRCFFAPYRLAYAKDLLWMGVVSGLPILPVLIPYFRMSKEHGIVRQLWEAHVNGANFSHFFAAAPGSLWYPLTDSLLLTRVALHEKYLFVGFAAILLLVVGLKGIKKQSPRAFWVLLTTLLFLAWMAHGPQARLYDVFYYLLPGFKAIRVPARIGLGYLFVVAVLVSFGVEFLWKSSRRNQILCAAAFSLCLLENRVFRSNYPIYDTEPALQQELRKSPGEPVAILPLQGGEFERLYQQMFYERPLWNGYSGFQPMPHKEAYDLQEKGECCERQYEILRKSGVRDLVVFAGESQWNSFLEKHCSTLTRNGRFSVFRCESNL